MTTLPPRDFVGSLSKGLAVLEILSNAPNGLRLTEVAASANLTRAGARRLLLTFVADGWVRQEERFFLLSPKILTLARRWLGQTSVWSYAEPVLQEVSQVVGASSSAAVLQGNEIVYVARVSGSAILTVALGVGARLPAHSTAMGRVLLSELDPAKLACFLGQVPIRAFTPKTITDTLELASRIADVKRDGYAIVDEELELGLRSIAVPVRSRSQKIIASVNVSTQSARHSCADMRDLFLPHLLRAAQRIEEYLVFE